MPVEIRELVIQAHLDENKGPGSTSASNKQQTSNVADDADAAERPRLNDLDPQTLQRIVDECMRQMLERLAEMKMR